MEKSETAQHIPLGSRGLFASQEATLYIREMAAASLQGD